jgi:hypothetical protein
MMDKPSVVLMSCRRFYSNGHSIHLSNMGDIVAWGTKFPEWSSPVIGLLMKLDPLGANDFMEEVGR